MSSIFAIELSLRFDPAVHQQLASLAAVRSGMDYGGKWELYRRAADLLVSHEGLFDRGCWDYFHGTAKAETDFRMWAAGLVSKEGARPQPSGHGDPFRGDPRYLTFTMACVLVDNTEAQFRVAQFCNVPQGQLWHKQTFLNILRNMRAINFACVERDTMYLIPRDPGWALTSSDLALDKFKYLRPIL